MKPRSRNKPPESADQMRIAVLLDPNRDAVLYKILSKCDQRYRAEMLRRLAYMSIQQADDMDVKKVRGSHHSDLGQPESGKDVSRAVLGGLPIDYLSG